MTFLPKIKIDLLGKTTQKSNIKLSLKSKFLTKKKIIFFVIAVITLVAASQLLFPKGTNKQSTVVKRGEIKNELALSGKIGAEEHVILQFQTGGQLSYLGVKEGDEVKKYQTIASLDQSQMQKNLHKYLNNYMNTRWDFDQTKEDNQSLLTQEMRRIVDQAQFSLNNAVLDVQIQDLAIKFSNLSSPIDGIVTRVDSPQASVNIYTPAQAQFEVVNPNTIYFDVTADQTEVVNLKRGQSGTIVFDSYPNENIKGIVSNISFTPKKDETGTVYEIKVALSNINNNSYKYRLGMTGDITFTTEDTQNVLYLPINAVKSDEKGKYVIGKNNEKKYIETGLENDTDIESIKGLSEGEIVYD